MRYLMRMKGLYISEDHSNYSVVIRDSGKLSESRVTRLNMVKIENYIC